MTLFLKHVFKCCMTRIYDFIKTNLEWHSRMSELVKMLTCCLLLYTYTSFVTASNGIEFVMIKWAKSTLGRVMVCQFVE